MPCLLKTIKNCDNFLGTVTLIKILDPYNWDDPVLQPKNDSNSPKIKEFKHYSSDNSITENLQKDNKQGQNFSNSILMNQHVKANFGKSWKDIKQLFAELSMKVYIIFRFFVKKIFCFLRIHLKFQGSKLKKQVNQK